MKYILLFEKFEKMRWELITSNPEKKINGKRLIDIVKNAYKTTKLGSMVKTMKDVLKSYWYVININSDKDIDACLFYRKHRKEENWKGFKIQGLGHDGDHKSKKLIIKKLVDILNNQKGYWCEASDILESILNAKGVKKITDEKTLKRLFPNSKIVLLKDGQYKRTLNDGQWITETVFGDPNF